MERFWPYRAQPSRQTLETRQGFRTESHTFPIELFLLNSDYVGNHVVERGATSGILQRSGTIILKKASLQVTRTEVRLISMDTGVVVDIWAAKCDINSVSCHDDVVYTAGPDGALTALHITASSTSNESARLAVTQQRDKTFTNGLTSLSVCAWPLSHEYPGALHAVQDRKSVV